MLRRSIRLLIPIALLVLAVASLLPDRYFPAGWLPYRVYQGEFSGRPVVLAPPAVRWATVPLEYHIAMTSGYCQIERVDRAGKIIPHSGMVSGYVMRDELPAGEQLRLDPGSGAGRYLVRMGLKYHPLAPLLRRSIAGGLLLGLVLNVFLRRGRTAWKKPWRTLFTPRQWAALLVYWALTGFFLYGAIHETGHALVGRALGGRVKSVVYTMLSGEEPHVNFDYLPDAAGPWMQAGGPFLPILVAYALVLAWLVLGRRLSRFAQALLLSPALLLLFSSFASPFDDHLLGLAQWLGFRRPAGIMLVKLIPVALTLAAYAVAGWRIWQQWLRGAMNRSVDDAGTAAAAGEIP